MSEIGVKNARIEAKRDEMHTDERGEDRIHDPDSGGENRTQMSDRSDVTTKP
jgi:hypothetical protein